MKSIQVEWCKNFIKASFDKIPFENGGIETNLFFKMAEKAGLYIPGTYGSPMSQALSEMVKVEPISDENGNFLYNVFRLI